MGIFLDNLELLMLNCNLFKISLSSILCVFHSNYNKIVSFIKEKHCFLLVMSSGNKKVRLIISILEMLILDIIIPMPLLEEIRIKLIKSFIIEADQVISSPDIIASEISKEFAKRFPSNPRVSFNEDVDFIFLSPIISDEDNELLIAIVSPKDVKEAMFDLAPDKSPEPDGFPPFFFQKYWYLDGIQLLEQ